MAKPPPPNRLAAQAKVKNAQYPKPFPALTPQSYIPGGAGAGIYPGYPQAGAPSPFPSLGPNSYLPPPGSMDPPIMNFTGGPGMLPPPSPFPSMLPTAMPPPSVFLPSAMPFPNQGAMSMMSPPPQQQQPPFYNSGLRSMSRRPVRICRRRGRRSRRCRPVIHVIESSSCSSISSCSTESVCSRRRHRSHSRSRRCDAAPQQQQQPIILLPVPMQQSQQSAPAPAPIQQQPQQIVLPPIQVQQPGSFQQQQLALPGIPMQQQQQLALPPIQFNSSNLMPSTNSSPIIIPSGQPLMQSSASMPQIVNLGQTQPIRGGAVQYVQAAPSSSSPLQYISSDRRSTTAPQRVLVNSTNKKKSTKTKPVARSTSVRDLPQNDLKFGRRPFDWYDSDKKNNIINEKVQVGQRGSAAVR